LEETAMELEKRAKRRRMAREEAMARCGEPGNGRGRGFEAR
jgi:hypothetical protein